MREVLELLTEKLNVSKILKLKIYMDILKV